MNTDYLQRILNSRVYDVAIEPPLERARVAIQVPNRSMTAFNAFLRALGYPCVNESANPAYRMPLG